MNPRRILTDILICAAIIACACVPVVAYDVHRLIVSTTPDPAAVGKLVGAATTTLSHVQTTSDAATAALSAIPPTLAHIQTTADAGTALVQSTVPVVAGLTTTEGKLNDAIETTSHGINAPCLPAPCGTLADVNRTLATLRGTSGQFENSLRVFNQHEGDLFTQEQAAYAGMSKSVTDFDALVSNPELSRVIGNAATITGDTAAMTTDGRTWLHGKLYPTKKRGFVNGFEATGDVFKHWLPPLF